MAIRTVTMGEAGILGTCGPLKGRNRIAVEIGTRNAPRGGGGKDRSGGVDLLSVKRGSVQEGIIRVGSVYPLGLNFYVVVDRKTTQHDCSMSRTFGVTAIMPNVR